MRVALVVVLGLVTFNVVMGTSQELKARASVEAASPADCSYQSASHRCRASPAPRTWQSSSRPLRATRRCCFRHTC
ncbi:hypothetical protein B4Q13_23580 [Lacticaseibacillus rhamnosus]